MVKLSHFAAILYSVYHTLQTFDTQPYNASILERKSVIADPIVSHNTTSSTGCLEKPCARTLSPMVSLPVSAYKITYTAEEEYILTGSGRRNPNNDCPIIKGHKSNSVAIHRRRTADNLRLKYEQLDMEEEQGKHGSGDLEM